MKATNRLWSETSQAAISNYSKSDLHQKKELLQKMKRKLLKSASCIATTDKDVTANCFRYY